MSILTAIDKLQPHRAPERRFAAFRTMLGLPADVELFYAFGSREPEDSREELRPPDRLLLESRTRLWWRDYSADPRYRLRDPVRRAVRSGFEPVVWRDLARRAEIEGSGVRMWQRVWDLGIQAGVTVPIHDAKRRMYGSMAVVSFGEQKEFEDWYEGLSNVLASYVYYFHHGLAKRTGIEEQPAMSLTQRERECLTLVARGASSKEIARQLELSPRTVDLHVARGCRRLSARNRIEAVCIALKGGLIDF